jgi:hypothetical protein
LVPAAIVVGTGLGFGAKSAITVCDEVIVNEHDEVVVPAHGPEIQPRNVDPFAGFSGDGVIEVPSEEFAVAVNVTSVPLAYVPVQLPGC